jgi:hypothetical protein
MGDGKRVIESEKYWPGHLPHKPDISFTPGFSPVTNADKKGETVLTVFSSVTTLRALITWRLRRRTGNR